jgi:hypothetical protein
MKKIAIAIAILLVATSFAMAGDVVISGEATTSFGFNLDDSTWGLDSSVSSGVSIVVGEADGSSAGEGAWYGVIDLTGASVSWDSDYAEADGALWFYGTDWNEDEEQLNDGTGDSDDNLDYYALPYIVTVPDVTAKITDGNLYAMLQSEAGFEADYVAGVDNDPMEFGSPDAVGSWTLGGMFGPASVAVELGTEGNYDGNAGEGIAFGVGLGVDVAPLMVDVAFAGSTGYATNDMGLALQLAADVAPLAVTAAFDYLVDSSAYEIGLAVAADLAPLTVGADVYFAEDDLDTALAVGFADDAMGVDVTVGAYDLTTTLVWNVALDLTFAVNSGVALAAGFSMDSAEIMAAYANVEMTELVDNVTFSLGWEGADDMGSVDADETDMGQVVFATTIAY